jgi:hypothetical protein
VSPAKPEHVPDWSNPSGYEALVHSERAGFAWEWLRRNDEYCTAALASIAARNRSASREEGAALHWNLHAFEDPRLPVPLARPVWTAERHPWVLAARAQRSSPSEDCFDLDKLSAFARLIDSPGGQRVLLSDGARSIRIDVTGPSLGSSPVRLSYDLAGVRELDRPLLVLRRLQSLVSRGTFSNSLYPSVCRARRLVALLRAFDALRAGASQSDIAAVLLRPRLERHRWRVHSPSLRSQAQRLVQCASRFANGGFWLLLA